MGHISTRVPDRVSDGLELMKDLKGLDSVSSLVRQYVEEGLTRDAANIEDSVQAHLRAEEARLNALVTQLRAPADTDPETGVPEEVVTPDSQVPPGTPPMI